jgi:hypothetical protein
MTWKAQVWNVKNLLQNAEKFSGQYHFFSRKLSIQIQFSFLYNGYQVFPGGKVRPGHDADPSPPSSAEVKNRVELYLYSP